MAKFDLKNLAATRLAYAKSVSAYFESAESKAEYRVLLDTERALWGATVDMVLQPYRAEGLRWRREIKE